jgi:hypothetical protein
VTGGPARAASLRRASARARLAVVRARLLAAAANAGESGEVGALLVQRTSAENRLASRVEMLAGGMDLAGPPPETVGNPVDDLRRLQKAREALLSALARVPDDRLDDALVSAEASLHEDLRCLRHLSQLPTAAEQAGACAETLAIVMRASRKALLTSVALLPPLQRTALSSRLSALSRQEADFLQHLKETEGSPATPRNDDWDSVWRRLHDVHLSLIRSLEERRAAPLPASAETALKSVLDEEQRLTQAVLSTVGLPE